MKPTAYLVFSIFLLASVLALSCGSSSKEEVFDPSAGSGQADEDDDEISDPARFFSLGDEPDPDSDFVPDWEEENCPIYECIGNTPPVLDQPLFMINGIQVSNLVSVSRGDEVQILIEYKDTQCNLACGSFNSHDLRPGFENCSAGSLPSNLPCDTASSALFLGFYFADVSAGHYDFMLFVNDYCGAESNRIEGGFSVL